MASLHRVCCCAPAPCQCHIALTSGHLQALVYAVNYKYQYLFSDEGGSGQIQKQSTYYSSDMHTWLRRVSLDPNIDHLIWASDPEDIKQNNGDYNQLTYYCCHLPNTQCNQPVGGPWQEQGQHIGWGDCSGFEWGKPDITANSEWQIYNDDAGVCTVCEPGASPPIPGDPGYIDGSFHTTVSSTATIKTTDIPRDTWVNREVIYFESYPSHAMIGIGGYCIPEEIQVSYDGMTAVLSIDNNGFQSPRVDTGHQGFYFSGGSALSYSGGGTAWQLSVGINEVRFEDFLSTDTGIVALDMWTRTGSGLTQSNKSVTIFRGPSAKNNNPPFALQPPRFYQVLANNNGSGDEFLVQTTDDPEAWYGLPGAGGTKYELTRFSETQCRFKELDYQHTQIIDLPINQSLLDFSTPNGDYTLREYWPQFIQGGTP